MLYEYELRVTIQCEAPLTEEEIESVQTLVREYEGVGGELPKGRILSADIRKLEPIAL